MSPELKVPTEQEVKLVDWCEENTAFIGEFETARGLIKVTEFKGEPMVFFYGKPDKVSVLCSDKVVEELREAGIIETKSGSF